MLDGLSDRDWDNDDNDVDEDGDVAADKSAAVEELWFSVSVDALLCASVEWFFSPCAVL